MTSICVTGCSASNTRVRAKRSNSRNAPARLRVGPSERYVWPKRLSISFEADHVHRPLDVLPKETEFRRRFDSEPYHARVPGARERSEPIKPQIESPVAARNLLRSQPDGVGLRSVCLAEELECQVNTVTIDPANRQVRAVQGCGEARDARAHSGGKVDRQE